jgi:hypothetical protein
MTTAPAAPLLQLCSLKPVRSDTCPDVMAAEEENSETEHVFVLTEKRGPASVLR